MTAPVSPHQPILAGNVETVPTTGSLTVDTNLRYPLQAFSATLVSTPAANAAHATASQQDNGGGMAQIVLKTWKTDHTTAGSVAAQVVWTALGK